MGISAEVCIVPKVAAEEYGASLGRNGRWEDDGFGTSQINRSRVWMVINHDKSWCELCQAVVDFLARSRDLKGWIFMESCGIYKQQDIARWYGDTMRYLRGFAAKWNERPTMTMADYAWAWLIGKISKIGTWFSEAWDWRCGVLGAYGPTVYRSDLRI